MKISSYKKIYKVIEKIPKGKVATYGQIAGLAGLSGHARQVGYALHALPNSRHVPWHRVINAKGEISKRAEPFFEGLQRHLLEEEGITFNSKDRVSLKDFGWRSK